MGTLGWILFWPEKGNKSIVFHAFRQCILMLLFFLSFVVNPSLFCVYLLLVSLIEYTRRCQLIHLLILFFFVTFSTWFAGFLIQPFSNNFYPKISIYDLLRGVFIFTSVVLDRLTAKRFSLTSRFTLFSFPILLATSFQFLSNVDHLGLSIHISSFCNDYPDITLFPLIFFGPAGLTFMIGFLASYTSYWRSMKFPTNFVSFLLFKVLPITIFSVSIANTLFKQKELTATISVIQNFNQNDTIHTFKLINEQLKGHPSKTDFLLVELPIYIDFTELNNEIVKINKIQKKLGDSLLMFSFIDYKTNSEKLYCVSENSIEEYDAKHHKKSKLPFITSFEKVLTVDTKLGKTGIMTGRDVFFTEFLASDSFDFLITFGGSEYDEKSFAYERSGPLISQMTGAARFHASAYASTFLIRGNGKSLFIDTSSSNEVRTFNLVSTNSIRIPAPGLKIILMNIIFTFASLIIVVMNFLPFRYARDISGYYQGARIFANKQVRRASYQN